MANRDAPSGFRPIRTLTGGECRINEYTIAAALGSDIYRGSLVALTGTDQNIDVAGVDAAVIGVFEGVKYIEPDGEIRYEKSWRSGQTLKAGTVAQALVYDDPDTIFEAQNSGTPVAADVGTLYSSTANAGSHSTGNASTEIDTATTGAGTQLKPLRLVKRPDNELGEFASMEVLLVKHQARIAV